MWTDSGPVGGCQANRKLHWMRSGLIIGIYVEYFGMKMTAAIPLKIEMPTGQTLTIRHFSSLIRVQEISFGYANRVSQV